MKTRSLKPGQRLWAYVDGKETKVVFSLETEEKGKKRRPYCFRLDAPHFPIIPKASKVEPIKFQESSTPRVPSAKKFLRLQNQTQEQ
jgi:hypothetical protein